RSGRASADDRSGIELDRSWRDRDLVRLRLNRVALEEDPAAYRDVRRQPHAEAGLIVAIDGDGQPAERRLAEPTGRAAPECLNDERSSRNVSEREAAAGVRHTTRCEEIRNAKPIAQRQHQHRLAGRLPGPVDNDTADARHARRNQTEPDVRDTLAKPHPRWPSVRGVRRAG